MHSVVVILLINYCISYSLHLLACTILLRGVMSGIKIRSNSFLDFSCKLSYLATNILHFMAALLRNMLHVQFFKILSKLLAAILLWFASSVFLVSLKSKAESFKALLGVQFGLNYFQQ